MISPMPMAEYQARPEVSRSDISLLLRSPAHYRWAKDNPIPSTDDQVFRSAIHTALFEPDIFAQTVVTQPETIKQRRGKDWETFLADHPGKTILRQWEFDAADAISDSVCSHPAARKLLDLYGGRAEHAVFWRNGEIGCRCRPDLIHPKRIVVDAKTIDDASPRGFRRLMLMHKWHLQPAYYMDGLEAAGEEMAGFCWIAIEEKPPYAIAVYQASEAIIRKGREDCRKGLDIYKQCLDSGTWPAYSEKIELMDLPEWQKK